MNKYTMTVPITLEYEEIAKLVQFGYIDSIVFACNEVQTEDVTNAIHGIIADLWKMRN